MVFEEGTTKNVSGEGEQLPATGNMGLNKKNIQECEIEDVSWELEAMRTQEQELYDEQEKTEEEEEEK